jgi:hypothetical protein
MLALGGQPLSPESERVRDAHAALMGAPNSADAQKAYLAAFPSSFREFLSIFMAPDFGQLYDGHDYIASLNGIGEAWPKETMRKLLKLGSDGTWDADAPNYLQDVTLTLSIAHATVFVASYSNLTMKEQEGLLTFLADGNEGPHPSFVALAAAVEKSGNSQLAKRMSGAAKASRTQADREHSR